MKTILVGLTIGVTAETGTHRSSKDEHATEQQSIARSKEELARERRGKTRQSLQETRHTKSTEASVSVVHTQVHTHVPALAPARARRGAWCDAVSECGV